jgi:heme o synthase
VLASLLPVYYGLSWIYLIGAISGGGYFLIKSVQLVRNPTRQAAMANFFASMMQLSVLLFGLMLEAIFAT